MIQVSHVTKEYKGGFVALQDISFSVEKGDFVFLCGSSGAGKTTAIKLLYMQEYPSSGTISICGFSSDSIRQREIPLLRRKLGIVFQDFKLLQDRSLFENVAFALRATGAKERSVKRRVFDVLAQTGLSHKADYLPGQLSGGEQQRACFARAIVNDPWVLLADEPTGNLDFEISKEIFCLLQTINARGTTVVMATHDAHLIEPYHYKRVFLSHGKIIDQNNPDLQENKSLTL